MMKTAEEILKPFKSYIIAYDDDGADKILFAMEEYASQFKQPLPDKKEVTEVRDIDIRRILLDWWNEFDVAEKGAEAFDTTNGCINKLRNLLSLPSQVVTEEAYSKEQMGELWQYVIDGAKSIMLGNRNGIGGFEDYIKSIKPQVVNVKEKEEILRKIKQQFDFRKERHVEIAKHRPEKIDNEWATGATLSLVDLLYATIEEILELRDYGDSLPASTPVKREEEK